jgi:hypothetical protein
VPSQNTSSRRTGPRPGERLFVGYAGMTVPLPIDRIEREAQVSIIP